MALADAKGRVHVSEYVGLEGHAERVFAAIDEAVRAAGVDRRELAAVACDVGPGSFTGVRVGVAAAAGIGLALGIPVVGVGSLEALARAAPLGRPVLSVLDAKKAEVFIGRFDANGASVGEARHIPLEEAAVEIRRALLDGVVIVGEIADSIVPGSALRGPATDLPDAATIAAVALSALNAGERRAALPVYVRPPDAKPQLAMVPSRHSG